MELKTVFVVLLMPDPSFPHEIGIVGIFTDEREAFRHCLDQRYRIAEFPLNAVHDGIEPMNVRWPNRFKQPDPDALRRDIHRVVAFKSRTCPECGGIRTDEQVARCGH